MKPSQVSASLRRIASKIEASKNPDRNLVARDLKRIVAEVVAAPAAPQNWLVNNRNRMLVDKILTASEDFKSSVVRSTSPTEVRAAFEKLFDVWRDVDASLPEDP